jgi:hypothetical protein
MKLKFKAKLYKVGINPCVKVPLPITDRLTAQKGFIYIKGKIEGHPFKQTLVPIKHAPYRLYVNGPMMKGSKVRLAQVVSFEIEQDSPKSRNVPMPKFFREELNRNEVMDRFKKLSPSRQKEILKYLRFLKTEESVKRNVYKVVNGLKGIEPATLFRLG